MKMETLPKARMHTFYGLIKYSKENCELDNYCLRHIVHIHWMDLVSNDMVQSCCSHEIQYNLSNAPVFLWSPLSGVSEVS